MHSAATMSRSIRGIRRIRRLDVSLMHNADHQRYVSQS